MRKTASKSTIGMVFYKYSAWTLVGVPTVIFAILMYASPKVIIGTETLNIPLALSLIGVAISYYGLIFSLYAALQVQSISNIYFFRIRSPELIKKLKRLSKVVSEFGTEASTDLYSQRFISEVSVALRAAKRVKNKHVKSVAKEAELSLVNLKGSMKTACALGTSAGQIPDYWDFYQKITELTDELSSQIEEVRAS